MTEAKITLSAVDKTAAGFASAKARLAGLAGEAQALTTRFGGVGAAITGALTLGGLGAFFTSITSGLDKLNDLKDATGASIGNISALEDVAARTGTSFDTVGTALLKLNKGLETAKPGDDISRTLEAIGLSAEQLRQLDPAEALLKISLQLAGFADNGDKARATQTLFGKSLREVAPLLKDLAEAGQLNATVTDEQAAAAERFANRAAASRKNHEDLGRAIVGQLLPVVEAVQDAFKGANDQGDRFAAVADAVRVPFEALAVLGANVAFVFGGVGREIGAILAQLGALARRDLAGFSAISDAVKADGVKARAELDAFEARVLRLASTKLVAGPGRGLVNPPQPDLPTLVVKPPPVAPVKAVVSEFDRYIQRIGDAIHGTQDLSTAEQARIDIAAGKLGDLTQKQRDYVIELANALDALRKPALFVGPEIDPNELAARDRAAQEIRRLVDSSQGAQFDSLVRQTQNVIDAFQAGTLSTQDYQRAIETLGEQFQGLEPKLEKIGDFAKKAGQEIESALGQTVLDSLEGSFSSIADLWKNLIKKLIAQAAGAQLGKLLLGDSFSKTGEVGGGLGSLIGAFAGLFGGSTPPARASGGPVAAGRPYLVGERGPELIVPRQAGTVMPTGAGYGGAAPSQTVVVNLNGPVPAETVAQIRAEVTAALSRYQRNAQFRGAA